MIDYKTNDYYRSESGNKSSPEVVLLAVIFACMIEDLSWGKIVIYFGF